MRFRDLVIGQEFDWINPDAIHNSFYGRCRKISPRRYKCFDIIYTVGTIDAKVYHVVGEVEK